MASEETVETDPIEETTDMWQFIGEAAFVAGVSLGRCAVAAGSAVGRTAKTAYEAVDPDVYRHAAYIPAMGAARLVPVTSEVQPREDDGHRPVVFVHGWGCHPGSFAPIRGFFSVMGRARTYVLDLTDLDSLGPMAGRLRDVIAEVVACNDLGEGGQVDLVGFSMGGIVARLALQDDETRARVHTVVTLGTPHAGTYLARYASTSLTLDLRPSSTVLAELTAFQEEAAAEDGPRFVALWSPSDMVILPPEGARMEGAENVEMEGFTHFSYLLHPRGWERVMWVLDD